MIWVDIIITLVLIFSFVGGLKEGAIKGFLSFLSLVIAIALTGIFYTSMTSLLTFIPDANWRNFIGFFVTFAIISIILGLIFWLPGRFFQKFWNGGCFFSIVGGLFSFLDAVLSIVLLVFIVNAFPIFDWLQYALNNSGVITWLTTYFGFINILLPEVFNKGTIVWNALPLFKTGKLIYIS